MPSAHHALGLTAVILCGEGGDLKPIITTTKLPKALLPVANKPLLQYPLDWVLDAGLDSIIIVCIAGQEPGIQALVDEVFASRGPQTSLPKNQRPLQKPKIVGATQPGSKTGTAEVLRQPQVYNLIKNDFMVLSCDSICEIPAATVIKEWMLLPETLGDHKGGLGIWYDVKKEKGVERDTVLTGPIPRFDLESKLRTTESRTDPTTELSYLLQNFGTRFDDAKSDIEIRKSLFKRHPKVTFQSAYRDAHIYIFPYWSLKFIIHSHKLKSVKDDVLSWWAKATWQGSGLLAHNLGMLQILNGEDDDGHNSDSLSVASYASQDRQINEDDVEKFLFLGSAKQPGSSTTDAAARARNEINTRGWFPTKTSDPSPEARSPTSSNDEEKPFKKIKLPPYNGLFVPGIAVFKPKMSITPLATTPLIRRVDTLPLFLSTSLEIARNPIHNPKPIHPAAVVDAKANVSNIDSMVGSGSQISEKVLVKRSVIGKNVKIGVGAKIQGSVILDGAKIGAGCKLEGCIIGRFADIGANTSLTNCQVIEDIFLKDRTVQKNEMIFRSSEDTDDEEEEDEDAWGGDGARDEDDSEEDDSDGEQDDNATTTQSVATTAQSIPTTTKEHVAPQSSTFTSNYAINSPTLQSQSQKVGTAQDATQEEEEEGGEGDGIAPEESGPAVPFLEIELQEEEAEEEEEEFEPDSDDSSYCAEEYDSNFESDELASGDDAGNLSGPEEDGGPLKSPKRISRGFADDMAKGIASMSLGAAMDGAKVEGKQDDALPETTEVREVKKEVDITPDSK